MTLEQSGRCFLFWALLGWARAQWVRVFRALHTKWRCQHPQHTSRDKDTCICNHRASPPHPLSLKKDLSSNKTHFTPIYDSCRPLPKSLVIAMISNVAFVSCGVEQWSWVTCSMIVCFIYTLWITFNQSHLQFSLENSPIVLGSVSFSLFLLFCHSLTHKNNSSFSLRR